MILQFFVQGIPKTAGSKRAFAIFRGSGSSRQFVRTVVTDDCKGSKDWKTTIAWAAKSAMGTLPIVKGAVKLSLVFALARPKSHYGTGKNASTLKPSAPKFHLHKPDCLKLARAVEDALTGIVYQDDSQIVCEPISKDWAWDGKAGVNIIVEEL